jgi:hypothetical protein
MGICLYKDNHVHLYLISEHEIFGIVAAVLVPTTADIASAMLLFSADFLSFPHLPPPGQPCPSDYWCQREDPSQPAGFGLGKLTLLICSEPEPSKPRTVALSSHLL